ncbi:helix-turn-helix domain-containing protein [Sphingobacterium sp. CZ-2]|uniref:helix-turn-helix domain-containing protein n=1 Tax=Sphingobacterium sp. CZ-2 TaxID=2557994 RepID=UPI00106FA047|nr:helix-turn-helix transcriptional regulator [Sphingobacterium sp. CZ-2]QBR13353.1 LuxR family transcriptional regulator [Sphingobacterium sp. CZ-2]
MKLDNFLFRKISQSFQEFSLYSQKSLGKAEALQRKKEFDLNNYLRVFHAFDTYFYSLADISTLTVIDAGGPIEQFTGYTKEEVIKRGYTLMLSIHHLKDTIRATRGGTKYFKYLYAQEPERRPYIKVNRTLDLICKDGRKLFVLAQSIPVLFNEHMEPIYMLNIYSDISDLQPSRQYSHYIIDSSDPEHPKKISLFDKNDYSDCFQSAVSKSEMRVLELIAKGMDSKLIADQLFISEHTVRTHRKNILRKMECSNMTEVVKKALVEGWL